MPAQPACTAGTCLTSLSTLCWHQAFACVVTLVGSCVQHARACRAPGFHGNAAHRWQQALRVVCLFLPQAGTLVVAVHHVVQAGAACTPSACCEWQLVDAIAVAGIAHQNSRSAGRPVALRHGHTLTNMVVLFQMKLRLVELPRAMWLAACTRVAHAIKVFVGGIC